MSLLLTGPNDGSGESGTTDLTTIMPHAGLFQFHFVYATLDPDPGFDFAGYTINNVFVWLADTSGQSGMLALPVIAGDTVGFRIGSVDNLGEAGTMTITNYSSPALVETPEPSGWSLMLIAAAFGVVATRRFSPLRVRKALVWTAVAILSVILAPLAQAQIEYTGTNVTGAMVLTRVVNLTRVSQSNVTLLGSPRLAAGIAPALPPGLPEPFPKFPNQRLRPGANGPAIASTPRGGLPDYASVGGLPAAAGITIHGLTVSSSSGLFGANVLSHADQRNADHGNQFSIEPPSVSVAASTSYVLEGVNNAVQVYQASGDPALPAVLSSNQVFGLAPAIIRGNGLNVPDVYGVYLTDMRVYFDQTISRWFVIQRAQDNDSAGNPMNLSHLYMAVSRTADPTGDYNVYVMDTTNMTHPGCPCIADYPQIGSDQYGFHIAWNEFNSYSYSFVDASILTLSKAGLAAGAANPTAYQFFLPYASGFEFALQPATTPPGASNFLASGGIEYFVSTLSQSSFNGGLSLWAMRNTSSMATPSPAPVLSRIVVSILPYAYPDVANQRNGPLPYGSTLVPPGQLAYLDGGDCRVQSLSYAGGRLFLTFATGVNDETGRWGVGGAYVVLSPTYRSGVLAAAVLNQGYLLVNGNHLLRPYLAVNPQGSGAFAVTLVGPDWYPSAAMIPFDTFSTPQSLQLAATGSAPEDGFTGYPGGGGFGVARWGDYNSAIASSDGAIWMVAQYIGNYYRTQYANWNTYLIRKQP